VGSRSVRERRRREERKEKKRKRKERRRKRRNRELARNKYNPHSQGRTPKNVFMSA
jgi:hypothetical protein